MKGERILETGLVVVTLFGAGGCAAEIKPTQTPQPIITPASFRPISAPEITLAPTPSTTPSVKPSPTEVSPINEVPLNELTKESGGAYDWPAGWGIGKNFYIQNATIVAVEKGSIPDSVMVALSLNGSKLTRKQVSVYPFNGKDIPMYYYEGLTVWYKIDNKSGLAIQNSTSDTSGGNPVPGGVDNIMPYLKVGNVIWTVEAPLSGGGTVSNATAKADLNTYNSINNSVGKANNRTKTYIMYADTITVVPNENK